jgi:hypothetical protein
MRTQLAFESNPAVGLAGAFDLVSGILAARRQQLGDDKASGPRLAKETGIREADMLSTGVDMLGHSRPFTVADVMDTGPDQSRRMQSIPKANTTASPMRDNHVFWVSLSAIKGRDIAANRASGTFARSCATPYEADRTMEAD